MVRSETHAGASSVKEEIVERAAHGEEERIHENSCADFELIRYRLA